MRYSVDSFENFGKGSVGSTYHWSVKEKNFKGVISNYLPDRTNDVMINWGNTSSGTYNLFVNETDEDGCLSLNQTIKIDVLALPPSYLSKQFVCLNSLTKEIVSPAVLDTKLNESDYSFNWKFNGNTIGTTSRIQAFELGSYIVEINDLKTGCKVDYEINVALSSSSISKIKTDNSFEDNQMIVISVINGIGNYEYSIDGINFQEDPNFYVSKGGVYYINVRDKNGCSDEVLQAHIATYPKFFTPNNDGYNDVWKIEGLIPQMNSTIAILDRYGKMIKVMHLDDSGWDGSINGFNLPADDYWFIIEYIDSKGIPVIFKSHFALMR